MDAAVAIYVSGDEHDAFMVMGAVIGLIFCLVQLFFLIKEKQAFEKAVAHVA